MNYKFLKILLILSSLQLGQAEEQDWSRTLEKISTGIVSIRVDSTRAFDANWNSSSQASGFVVDAKNGLILTNRHVVTSGPVIAEAVFLNNEEVRLTPVYRDPVHDFGFFRYQPKELKHIKPVELVLAPDSANVGESIRIIGNDSGEQLSILDGTLARMDRKAPDYGRGNYNDFNTFYFQASSGTSGGSSGAPVINISGEVIALNAGATNSSASSFFLPLNRIKRVLSLLQKKQPIERGSLQSEFVIYTFDELSRLGLSNETEILVRTHNKELFGMLVAKFIVPESPAFGKIRPGDILVRINGKLVTDFLEFASIIDNKVGEMISVELERSGQIIKEMIEVTDLHSITPDTFLQFGDAVVHNLSYQQVRHHNQPLKGIYVADPGYIFSKSAIPHGAIIHEVDGKAVESIDSLKAILSVLDDGDRATIRFTTMDDPNNSIVRLIQMDRVWFPLKHCIRDDSLGIWSCQELENNFIKSVPKKSKTQFPQYKNKTLDTISKSLVMVNFDLPYTLSGVSEQHYYGTGLIIDAKKGLILIDRNTVPIAMGDVRITFAGSLEIDGQVEYIHPLHNLAVVSYDPSLIGNTPVKTASFNTKPLVSGQNVLVVGLKMDHQLAYQESNVSSIGPITIPLSRTLRFREANVDGINLVNGPENFDGVIVGENGSVSALWSSFSIYSDGEMRQFNRGISSELLAELIDVVKTDRSIYSLEVEARYLPLFAARKLGLDDLWLEKLEQRAAENRRVLSVSRVVAGTPAEKVLRNGDIILAINDQIITSFRELEKTTQKTNVVVTVLRNKEIQKVDVSTVQLDGKGIQHMVLWAGALLQNPYREMALQRGINPEGVYVAFYNYGSPATRYGLWAGRRIMEVDGIKTPNLEEFVTVAREKHGQKSLRLTTVTMNGSIEVITLKLDNQYWPTYEIKKTTHGWQRFSIN